MILLRHGQSEFNVIYGATRVDPGIEDPALTDLGREQARGAATFLAGLGLTRIISSPYTRALQTATAVADATGLPIEIDPLVREHYHFICDIGTAAALLADRWPGIDFTDLQERWWPHEHETPDRVQARCDAFKRRLPNLADHDTTLVVTHWGFIRGVTGLPVTNCTAVRIDRDGAGTVVHEPEP